MHTAQVSQVRSAIQDYFEEDDSEWVVKTKGSVNQEVNPHISEHEARAAELLAEHDEDAAIIHELLGKNIIRAAHHSN